ncbi:hypothetical protein ACA910_003570 [Epithemia clementina (nom. ined.)]
MVHSFSEDPFEGASASSHAFLDSDANPQSVGEECLVNDANSLGNNYGNAPSDKTSVKIVARNANRLDHLATELQVVPPQAAIPSTSTAVPSLQGQQQSRTPTPTPAKQLNAFKLPFPLPLLAKTSFLASPLSDWCNLFCTDLHFPLVLDPSAWTSFTSSFAKVADPPCCRNSWIATSKNMQRSSLVSTDEATLLLSITCALPLAPGHCCLQSRISYV